MATDTERTAPPAGKAWRRRIQAALFGMVIALVYVLFHVLGNTTLPATYSGSAFRWMVRYWNYTQGFGGANYTQGWLIPIVSLWFIWRDRRALAAAARRVSLAGLAVVVLALLLHWIGAKTQQTRLSLFAFILLAWGIPFYCFGWAVARRLVFPCAFLVFCIPLNFLDGAWYRLRLGSTWLAATLLNGLVAQARTIGSTIQLDAPNGFIFDSADPASSIRMALAVAAFAAVWGRLTLESAPKRLILFCAAALFALLGNTVRCVVVGLVSQGFGDNAARVMLGLPSSFITYTTAAALTVGSGILLRRMTRHWIRTWTERLTAPSSF